MCKPKVTCPLHQSINYLSTEYHNQTYYNSTLVAIPGTIATLYCSPDHLNKGSWNNTCTDNGTWVGEEPFCPGMFCFADENINLFDNSLILK